ncbi:MAG: carbohydrate kinase family protein [Anaerolineae bacterium]|nr:carbohydrate kinase family protein [Anaerolineae bacterium]
MVDVFLYGGIGIDNLVYVPFMPTPARQVVPTRDVYQIGGGGVHAALWLATWGVSVRIAGNSLGMDADGDRVMGWLAMYPCIDTSMIVRSPDRITPFIRALITPDGDRTMIAYWYFDGPWSPITPEAIDGAKVFGLNIYGGHEHMGAIEVAKAAGAQTVIADMVHVEHPTLPFVDMLVNSASVMQDALPGVDVRQQTRALNAAHGAPVIVTDGGNDVFAVDHEGVAFTVTPPRVAVTDATGAGDSFLGAVIYSRLQGWPLERTVRLAAATGALQAARDCSTSRPSPLTEVIELAETLRMSPVA